MRLIDADALEKAKFHPLPYTHIVPQDTDAESYKRGWNDAIDAIVENEPTVSAESQWILCNERLPEDGTWCLFTDGENMSVERYKADAIDAFFPTGRWFDLDDAVAWMPIPKPWKGGQDGRRYDQQTDGD